MKFIINENKWKIKQVTKQNLLDKYNSENEEKSTYVFGLTQYSKHEIWINKDMCMEQQINTLKHELTHCYIWSYGLYNIPNYTEEMVCDLVSSINNFINKIVEDFIKNFKQI